MNRSVLSLGALAALTALTASSTASAQETNACISGMTREPSGYCCWPEQRWSEERGRCVGIPRCPAGTAGAGDGCQSLRVPVASGGVGMVRTGNSGRDGVVEDAEPVFQIDLRNHPVAQDRVRFRATALEVSGVIVGVVTQIYQLTAGIIGAFGWHQCFGGFSCGPIGTGGAIGLSFLPVIGPPISAAGANSYSAAGEFAAYALPTTLLSGLALGLLFGGVRLHAEENKLRQQRHALIHDLGVMPLTSFTGFTGFTSFPSGAPMGLSVMFTTD